MMLASLLLDDRELACFLPSLALQLLFGLLLPLLCIFLRYPPPVCVLNGKVGELLPRGFSLVLPKFAQGKLHDYAVLDVFELFCDYVVHVVRQVGNVCCQARVANVEASLLLGDEVCEAEDVVHDKHRNDFIHSLHVVLLFRLERHHRANEYDLGNRAHDEDEELKDQQASEPYD